MHLQMVDLEKLHQNATRLKTLTLNDVTLRLSELLIYPSTFELSLVNDITGRFVVREPVPVQLQTLTIRVSSGRPFPDHEETITPAWLTYIAAKYTMLTSFAVNCERNTRFLKKPVQRTVLQLLPNSPMLTNYEMVFCPITQEISKKMDERNIQLNSISLYAQLKNTSSQLSALANSNQKQTIENMTITMNDMVYNECTEQRYFADERMLEHTVSCGQFISQHLEAFSRLTNLRIQGSRNSIHLASLSQYLKDLRNLISIALVNVYIDPAPISLDSVSHIRYIRLIKVSIINSENMLVLNKYLQQTLPWCPRVTKFTLVLRYYNDGPSPTLNLDFRSLPSLVYVQLSEWHSKFYEIVRGDESKFYEHKISLKKFVELPSNYEEMVHVIRIVLDKSVVINRTRI
jgi:hypothetical protein